MNKMILIDFSWLYNRYYFVSQYALNQEEEPQPEDGLEQVLFRRLYQFLSLIQKNYPYPNKVFVALDPSTSCLKNFSLCQEYKQNRNKEVKKEVYSILNKIVKKLVEKLDSKVFIFIKAKEYEADQTLALVAKKFHENNEIIIFSGDKDLIQLTAYPNVYISDKFEKGKFLIKSDEELFGKFKNNKGEDFTRISKNKRDILKYRVLKGDTSDNLSPVFPRIKDTEIIDIIRLYWIDEEELTESRIDDILDDLKWDNSKLAEKLKIGRENWIRNYKIMKLYDIEEFKVKRVK